MTTQHLTTTPSIHPVSKPLAVSRVNSIDVVRGFIMIIMAIDHVRDYMNADAFLFDPTDLGKTTIPLFFTRFITHYCAPTFVFLAGTSAYLSGLKKTKNELSSFLLTRGIWLVILEMTLVNLGWFFNLHFTFFLLGVIWTLGICMIVLAALIHLPKWLLLTFGLSLVLFHNLLDGIHVEGNNLPALGWAMLHDQRVFTFGDFVILAAYPLIPWLGVMPLGYCLGSIYKPGFDARRRKRILVSLGLMAIGLFILLRSINVYGNLWPWTTESRPGFTFLSFLNVSKYPPSLDYLLVTLGPSLLFLAYFERPLNRFTKIIATYGRVPLFFYLLHIFLIHFIAMFAAVLTGFKWTDMTSFTFWINALPKLKGFGFSLLIVYAVWLLVLVILYPLCKWYDRYKTTHKHNRWLSYL
jgi:uncharacterized membrane protein